MDHSSDIDDDVGPEDVHFSHARTLAVEKRVQEDLTTQKLKDLKKDGARKKQAWFRDQKVAKTVKHNSQVAVLPSGKQQRSNSKNQNPENLPAVSKSTSKLAKTSDKLDLDGEEYFSDEDEDMNETGELALVHAPVSTVSASLVNRRGKKLKVVSLSSIFATRFGLIRPETVLAAKEHLNPKNVNRIPASKLASIAAKRRGCTS